MLLTWESLYWTSRGGEKAYFKEGLLDGKGWHYLFMEESPGFVKTAMSN